MNRSSSLGAVVFFIVVISGLNVAVMGQVGSATVRPTYPNEPSARPVLKVQAHAPDSPTTDLPSDAQKPLAKQDYPPQTTEVMGRDLVKVKFSGLYALHDEDVLKTFQEQRVAFPRTRLPEFEDINKAAAVLKEMLQSHGYLRAQVDGIKDEASQTVRFVVEEGVRLPIAEIGFSGNRIFSTPELVARMRDCLADYEDNGPGYGRDILERCQQRLTSFVWSRGYLQAKLGEPKNQVAQQGLVITIPVEEGILYRLGEVKIEGSNVASPEQLRSRLPLAKGDIANGEMFGKWAYEDLKKLYGNLGYIEFTAELNPEFKKATDDSNEGLLNLKFTIDEGKQFRLHSIKFVGSKLPEKEMRKLFQMKDGDVYSQQLFEAGIKKLNEKGLLEFVDADGDSDFKTDEERGLIAIVIKVSPRADASHF